MIRNTTVIVLMTLASTTCLRAMDLEKVDQDLNTPSVAYGLPAPGKRVKLFLPEYDGTDVYHALYLPIDWKKEGKSAWGEGASEAWQRRAVRESALERWGTPADIAGAVRWPARSPRSAGWVKASRR